MLRTSENTEYYYIKQVDIDRLVERLAKRTRVSREKVNLESKK